MRRSEIKINEVYAASFGTRGSVVPLVPVAAVAELNVHHGHGANMTVARARGDQRRKVGGIRGDGMQNIGLLFTGRDRNLANFDVWAESQDEEFRPLLLAAAFETAEQLRAWMADIPEGKERVVPDGMIPTGLRLAGFLSRDLIGDWLTERGDQLTRQREQRERDERAKLERSSQRDAFGAVADRVLALLDVSEVKPGKDFYGIHPDYSVAQLPMTALTAMLDELERARGGSGSVAPRGVGGAGSAE
jgi:hypothetical protein